MTWADESESSYPALWECFHRTGHHLGSTPQGGSGLHVCSVMFNLGLMLPAFVWPLRILHPVCTIWVVGPAVSLNNEKG
ncbi:hypothetical protein N7468_007218 [Penicillium chermesinum]|uniref:Uncharacterized protein n=1 Tax=Penicillium chermesinum TaxID=63820 RepID=A0A9W9TKG3_9EURO|nr:uncharacterized protein N7468_007218 [Penicillium chermesinum]KAJ5225993.1 hypothetical protein N7468_007218 [Penicillium chermesinum]